MLGSVRFPENAHSSTRPDRRRLIATSFWISPYAESRLQTSPPLRYLVIRTPSRPNQGNPHIPNWRRHHAVSGVLSAPGQGNPQYRNPGATAARPSSPQVQALGAPHGPGQGNPTLPAYGVPPRPGNGIPQMPGPAAPHGRRKLDSSGRPGIFPAPPMFAAFVPAGRAVYSGNPLIMVIFVWRGKRKNLSLLFRLMAPACSDARTWYCWEYRIYGPDYALSSPEYL